VARNLEGEATVQRLLAEAGGPVPMPPEVAARLDDVLAGLQRDRALGSTAETPSAVTELRARRRWPRVLLAAAAVVVGGYGAGTVLSQGTLSGSESATSGDAAGSDALLEDRDANHGEDGAGAPSEGRPEGQVARDRTKNGSAAALAGPVPVRSDELEADVRRALRVLDVATTADLRSGVFGLRAKSGCAVPPLDERERPLRVRYDGEPAVLVAGPEREELVEVTIYSCSGTEIDDLRVRH
jgi:hypothetical protein